MRASGSRSLWRDRKGLAVIEAAFVLPAFLTLILLIVAVGIYFTLQSALDVGVLTAAESLRVNMAVGSSYTPPSASVLKAAIASNGGAVMQVANLAVDVRQLTTLSASSVAIVDGTYDWGGSGSILVVRAQTTLPFLPSVSALTIVSTSVVRRPPY